MKNRSILRIKNSDAAWIAFCILSTWLNLCADLSFATPKGRAEDGPDASFQICKRRRISPSESHPILTNEPRVEDETPDEKDTIPIPGEHRYSNTAESSGVDGRQSSENCRVTDALRARYQARSISCLPEDPQIHILSY